MLKKGGKRGFFYLGIFIKKVHSLQNTPLVVLLLLFFAPSYSGLKYVLVKKSNTR